MRARISTLSDEEPVSELLLDSYTALMAKDYEAQTLAAALPRMTRANPGLLGSGTFYVVDGRASRIVGCGGWTLAAPGSGSATEGVAHLRHFATHPDFARQGIGRMIFEQCAAAARLAGATRFQAYSSLTAVAFYAGMGLEIVRNFDLLLGGEAKLPAALMEGSL